MVGTLLRVLFQTFHQSGVLSVGGKEDVSHASTMGNTVQLSRWPLEINWEGRNNFLINRFRGEGGERGGEGGERGGGERGGGGEEEAAKVGE